ncbi:MAG: LexA family transcriptional regulator [Clostridiales bacterium]|nr:LexA family transcriptional regulator [Clostridiales bacterium]
MIGDMIAEIRKQKGMTKTELAKLTDINIGHLTHIEKGERNPSHKALKNICKALGVPYQQLMYTYDKQLSEEQESYGFIKHIAYNKVLAIDTIHGLIDCPDNISSASLAIKIRDTSMEPKIKANEYIFIEFNSLLNNKDIGLFKVNNKIMVRRFYSKKGQITLKPDNKEFEELKITNSDNFYIIGKVLGK